MILDVADGGRGCPSAVVLWTREVYEVIEQCVSLPGKISQITTREGAAAPTARRCIKWKGGGGDQSHEA
jgi:hypothetical protein